MGTKILPIDAYPVHYFIDEFTSIAMLPLLDEGTLFEVPTEQEKVMLREEESSKFTDSDLKVLGEVSREDPGPKVKRKKRTRSSLELKASADFASKKSKAQFSCPSVSSQTCSNSPFILKRTSGQDERL